MTKEISVDHHFVPVAMLRRWSVGQEATVLRAFYWDHYRSRLSTRSRGPKAFCYQPHLLTATGHPSGDDYYERDVFGAIDDAGANGIAGLLAARQLSDVDRMHFTRFLLSLEARRPSVVEAIRKHGSRRIAAMLDSDPVIIAATKAEGYAEAPSVVQATLKGMALESELLKVVEMLVTKSRFARRISDAYWQVRWADPSGSSFALGDRPLIRFNATGDDMVWVLPLRPDAVFVATGNQRARQQIAAMSSKQIVRAVNSDSAMQCDRFVFWKDEGPTGWLARRLGVRHQMPKQSADDFSISR